MAFISKKLRKKSSKSGSDDWGTGRPGEVLSKTQSSSTLGSAPDPVPTSLYQRPAPEARFSQPNGPPTGPPNGPASGYYSSPGPYGGSPQYRPQSTPTSQQHYSFPQQRPFPQQQSPMKTPLASPSNAQFHTGEVQRHSPKLQQSPYGPQNGYPRLASPPVFDDAKRQPRHMATTSQSSAIISGPWKKKRLINSPFPRFSHSASATTSEDGAIYVMGGLRDDKVYGDIWMISPTKEGANYSYYGRPVENFDRIPVPRVWHDSVLVGNAFIVFGGDTIQTTPSHELDNNLYFFNINSLKWTIPKPNGPRPRGRYGHRVSVVNFQISEESDAWLSYLYVFGGELDNKYLNPELDHEYFNDMWCFDLSNFRKPTTQWRQVVPKEGSFVPPPLSGHTMTVYNDRIYVYGGASDGKASNKLYQFNPIEETWTVCELRGTFVPPALQEHAATLYKNLLFIFGGKTDGVPSDQMFCIDLNAFVAFRLDTRFGNGPGARFGHSMTIDIVNSKLVIMGGEQDDENLEGAEDTDEAAYDAHTTAVYEFDLMLLKDYVNKSDLDSLADVVLNSEDEQSEFEDASSVKEIEPQPVYKESESINGAESESLNRSQTEPVNREVSSNISKESPPLSRGVETAQATTVSPISASSKQVGLSPVVSSTPVEIPGSFPSESPVKPQHPFRDVSSAYSQASKEPHSYRDVSSAYSETPLASSATEATPFREVASREVSGGSVLPGSFPEKRRSEEKLTQLTQMVSSLKLEMADKVKEADGRISSLEQTRQANVARIHELEQQLAEKDSQASREVEPEALSTLRRHKVELSTQLAGLQDENAALRQKSEQFEQHISDLGALNEIVKSQTGVIQKLQASLRGEAELKKEINDWKLKYENLLTDHENVRAVYHLDDEAEPEDVHSKISGISANVDNILASWSNGSTREVAASDSTATQLQSHVNELLEANQEQEAKLSQLESIKAELEQKVKQLEEQHDGVKQSHASAEENYKKSVHTLNNTHKALSLSQSEVERLRELNKKLSAENENLRLFKASHRQGSRNTTPVLGHEAAPAAHEEEDDDEVSNHYDLKIKDMEADLYIVSQERDQLKEEVHALKKKLFGKS